MKLVIDIPDKVYGIIKYFESDLDSNYEKENDIKTILIKAVFNGTPLPKEHGKIGDLDALREEVSSWGINDYEPSDFIDVIDQADTIIEADMTESDAPNFESEKYVEDRINNYDNMLKSGILDCVIDDVGIHESVNESEE